MGQLLWNDPDPAICREKPLSGALLLLRHPTCDVASGIWRAAAGVLMAHAASRASRARARGVARGMAQRLGRLGWEE